MMRRAPRPIRQFLFPTQLLVKLLALRLRTRVLPVRAVSMAKGRALHAPLLEPGSQLLLQRLPTRAIQPRKQLTRLLPPEYGAMLHTRTTDALDLAKVRSLLFQPLQHQVDGLEEHGNGCKHLALAGVGEDALFDAMVGEIGVKVDFGFVDEFEIGADDDSCGCPSLALGPASRRWWGSCGGVVRTLQLLRAQVEAQELVSHCHGGIWKDLWSGFDCRIVDATSNYPVSREAQVHRGCIQH
jgi:hypothetical protein